MNDLQEEIDFLKGEINSLKGRIGTGGNDVQKHKLAMLKRLLLRCETSKKRRELPND